MSDKIGAAIWIGICILVAILGGAIGHWLDVYVDAPGFFRVMGAIVGFCLPCLIADTIDGCGL